MTNRIDVHCHMIPPFWAEELADKIGQPAWGTPDWSPESALAVMDRLGIQTQILSLSSPALLGWEGEERTAMCRRVNDYGAELARAHPDRFGFFATLQLPDVDGAVAEMDRALDTLGADGVVLLSNYHGVYLGDPGFAPLWEAMERRKVVLYIHPGEAKIEPIAGTPAPVVDFVMDTTRMAVDMVAKGVMERYPWVILSHAGGFLPYAAARFKVLLHAFVTRDKSEEALLKDLKAFYLDTALSTPTGLPSLMAFAEPGHVLFATDNPYVSPDGLATFTRELDTYDGFTPGQLEGINRTNAEALFPRLRTSA